MRRRKREDGYVRRSTSASILRWRVPQIEMHGCRYTLIASRSSALPEVTGDAGLLVDAENTAEVVPAVKFVFGDRAATSELSARGRKRAEHYRWESYVGRLLSALGDQ